VLSLTVAACSIKTLYNRLDYLIPSYVEGMVSLDDVLEEKVEQRTQTLINWHRNTQLIQYADLLRTFQQDLDSPLTEEQVIQHIYAMELLWYPLAQKVNQEMAALLPLLNAKQREELFASIEEKNEDFYDDYVDLDDEERIEQYTESMLDNYESWFGELDQRQQQYVEQAAYQIHSSASLRLQQRKVWQQNIREILESADNTEKKTERLGTFFQSFNIDDDVQLASANAANVQLFAKLTVQIVNHLSLDQKQYFIDKTNDYIRIFTELAENR
jgi:hypothetical protein